MPEHQYRPKNAFVPRFVVLAAMLALSACDNGRDAGQAPDQPPDLTRDTDSSDGAVASPVADSDALSQPDIFMGDMVLGDPSASVTVIEYASMTCSHCASFHKYTYGRLVTDYVDTGKIKFVFREFPLDKYALEASVLARCAGQDKYFELVGKLFDEQEDWVLGSNPSRALRGYLDDAGLTDEQYDACLDNDNLANRILARRTEAEKRYKVQGTPAIVINGKLFKGAPAFQNLARAIDEILKE